MKFSKKYFLLFVILLIIETCIAIFLEDGFIRHTFGDFLVVIMLYCLLKSLFSTKPLIIALIVLAISFGIELLQLTNFLEWIGLEQNPYAKVILGNTFHISDLIAYSLGVIVVLIVDLYFNSEKRNY
jgi:hypothetical protein